MNLFRVYRPDELGGDGYPHEWHGCCGELEHDPAGGVKDRVRAEALHRCVRCGHPYEAGKHGNGEWSPCDFHCTHGGPLRGMAVVDGPGISLISDEDLARDGVNAGDWADLARIEAQWRILTVHHLNGVKHDLRWWNLAALCQRCHLHIQGRVNMAQVWPHEHSEWFKPYAAGYYAAVYLDEELTREQTMDRLDELLALEAAPSLLAEDCK